MRLALREPSSGSITPLLAVGGRESADARKAMDEPPAAVALEGSDSGGDAPAAAPRRKAALHAGSEEGGSQGGSDEEGGGGDDWRRGRRATGLEALPGRGGRRGVEIEEDPRAGQLVAADRASSAGDGASQRSGSDMQDGTSVTSGAAGEGGAEELAIDARWAISWHG